MPSTDFEAATKQEEARLQKLHPAPDDIPGCMSLFDTFLSCNGVSPDPTQNFHQLTPYHIAFQSYASISSPYTDLAKCQHAATN